MPPRRGSGTPTTPWAASPRGSLLSDRIRPSGPAQQPAKSERGKGKAKAAATSEPPRSAAVRRLDELLAGLRSSSSSESKKATGAAANPRADRDEGCFCQARAHALSEYTPLCTACGLVLCDLHAPHRPCPHCATPLLAPPARAALIAQLEDLRGHTLAEEAAVRERKVEELRRAEGAFPALGPSQPPSAGSGAGAGGSGSGHQQHHRVLSFDVVTKRVKVQSYGKSAVGKVVVEEGGGDDGGDGDGDATLPPVPPPPREVECVRVGRGPATRWVDLKAAGSVGTARYVVPPSE